MDELEKRIQEEYESFYLDTIRTSKDNLYSHAEEIAIKRCIVTTVRSWKGVLTTRQMYAICTESNILDAIYRRMSEQISAEYMLQIEKAIEKYSANLY